jgi:pimeloyl-ACP methyl ester carboxylesterase
MNAIRILAGLLLTASCDSPDPVTNVTFIMPVRGIAGSGLERAEFGRDCALEAVPDERDLQTAVEHRTCLKLYQPDFVVAAEHFDGPYGSLPLIIYRPRENVEIRRIVVRIIGGPGESIRRAIGSDEGRLLGERARQGIATVFLGYVGTQHRFLEGVDTIDMAANELAAYAGALGRSHPDTPIAVVGESLGGYIAARAAPNLPRIPTILIAPLVSKPRDLLAHLAASSPERIDFDRSLVTLSRVRDGRIEPMRSEMLYHSRMLTGIVSRHLDVRLAELLAPTRGECVAIIYGEADEVIGTPSIPELRQVLPQARISMVPGMGHSPSSAAERARVEQEIESVMSSLRDCR